MNRVQRLGHLGRFSLYGGLIAAIAVVGAACSSDEDDGDEPQAPAVAGALDSRGYDDGYRLVTADWLADHLDDDDVVVVDLRSEEDYVAGHIPGAVRLDTGAAFSRTDENGVKGQIATADQLAEALGGGGISPDTTIVLYDGNSSLWSSRALWVLDVYGHAQTRILDGSYPTWADGGHEVSTEAPQVTAVSYAFSGQPNEAIIAGYAELVAAINDPEKLVCDARSAEEYAGRDVRSAQGGHVPGALNEDWRQAVNEKGEFRSADELRGIYEDTLLVSDDADTVYVYCQTGVRAAHTWFVLSELLGLENVKNYDGSWEEYGNRTDAPIDRS